MRISNVPLSPHLGVRILDIDASQPLGDEVIAAIRRAWLDANGLALFPDQHLTPEQHIAFSRRFGSLMQQTENVAQDVANPELKIISNKVENGKPIGRIAGTYWHSDHSFAASPTMATLLYGIEVPPSGGDTMFANMYLAYDTLSEKMKLFLSDLKAHHDNAFKAASGKSYEGSVRRPSSIHPVVRTHPETGRKALYINQGFTSHIVDLPRDESAAILDFLIRHSTRPEFTYRHHWQPHDLLLFDDRCLIHYGVNDYDGRYTRHVNQTMVAGDAPY